MPAARPTAAAIKRAINAWTDCGLTVGAIEVAPDGTIRIVAASSAAPLPSGKSPEEMECDRLFGMGA